MIPKIMWKSPAQRYDQRKLIGQSTFLCIHVFGSQVQIYEPKTNGYVEALLNYLQGDVSLYTCIRLLQVCNDDLVHF